MAGGGLTFVCIEDVVDKCRNGRLASLAVTGEGKRGRGLGLQSRTGQGGQRGRMRAPCCYVGWRMGGVF